MEVSIDIRYEQLLEAIKKLPAAKIKQLRSVLDDSFINEKAAEELSDFQNYLLKGPVIHRRSIIIADKVLPLNRGLLFSQNRISIYGRI